MKGKVNGQWVVVLIPVVPHVTVIANGVQPHSCAEYRKSRPVDWGWYNPYQHSSTPWIHFSSLWTIQWMFPSQTGQVIIRRFWTFVWRRHFIAMRVYQSSRALCYICENDLTAAGRPHRGVIPRGRTWNRCKGGGDMCVPFVDQKGPHPQEFLQLQFFHFLARCQNQSRTRM